MSGTIQYTIRPYDTIWMLAQIFNTTVDSIMDLNPGIEPRNLQVGQVITIMPGYQYYPVQMEPQPGTRRPVTPEVPTSPRNSVMPGMPMTPRMPGDTGRPMAPGMPGTPMTPGMPEGPSMTPGMDGDMMSSELVELLTIMRVLWGEHVIWTHNAVINLVHDLPEAELVTQRLLRNVDDFAGFLSNFYDDDVLQRFRELFTDHITIAADIVMAADEGDMEEVNTLEESWYDNADQLAAFFAEINPNWSEDDWDAMLSEHLELLSQYVQELLNENYEESINLFDDILSQAFEMADMMAEGIYMQIAE